MSAPQGEPAGKAGRYQRSAAGLVTSLVVTVVAIGAVLFFMGVFRNDFETRPERVDYLEAVTSAQSAGLTPSYPRSLPEGWIATGVDIAPGDQPSFMLRLLTDDNKFVAVRQEAASPLALLHQWVDEEVEVAEGYSVPDDVRRPVARDWKGYTDDGGDTAYVADVGEETLMVFGSASAADLQAVIGALVTTPLR